MTGGYTGEIAAILLWASAGAVAGCMAGCIPSLHVYSLMGAALLLGGADAAAADGPWLAPFAVGMVTAWSVMNTLPAVLLSAPDESALFTVLPGQRYFMLGRGHEAIALSAMGAAGALIVLVALLPFSPGILPKIHAVLSPHYHWILWTVICFMLLSEWPKGRTAARAPWDRFATGSANVFAGLATFVLSGLLGFLLLYRSPLPIEKASQNLMPVFSGLFAVPWLVFNLLSRIELPPQYRIRSVDVDAPTFLQGLCAGVLGGAFSAFVPVVSGGVGGLLAGHAASIRDERAFLISQGASKAMYYAGGLMLLFVPGLAVARGGAAWMVQTVRYPDPADFGAAVLGLAIGGFISLLLLPFCSRVMTGIAAKTGFRSLSLVALALIVLIVAVTTGWIGLALMTVAAGIGLIPVLFDARRMNCLGVILLPMACNMSGVGAAVAAALGLIP